MYESVPSISLGPVRLTVGDARELQAFYERVVGLQRLADGPDPAIVRLGAATDGPALLELAGDADAPVRAPGASGLVHAGLLLPDRPSLGQALNRVVESGWKLDGAIDHLVREALSLTDPEGNGIELSCDRERPRPGWWRDERSDVNMPASPIDLDELATIADGDGALPGGTRVGNVHLRVPDLDTAERFYVDRLGMAVTVRSRPGELFLASDGYHHHFGLSATAGADAPPYDPSARGLRDVTLLLEDRDRDRLAGRIADGGQELGWDGGDLVVPAPFGMTFRLRTR